MDVDQLELVSPFGPKILISQCPQEIVNALNDYTEKVCGNENLKNEYSSFGNGNVPNLLERNLENIFIDNDFCKNLKIKNYLEKIGNLYLQETKNNFEFKVKLKTIFDNQKEIGECWINRYFGADFTQLHVHSAALSGVIFLKIPKFLSENNLNNNYTKSQGKISFIYGSDRKFCDDIWFPDQKVGTILVFPSWLKHVAYPTQCNEERRTFSFNLILEPIEKNIKNKITYS